MSLRMLNVSSRPANRPTATARSNPITPTATASSTSGNSTRCLLVATRSHAASGATSSRPATHSPKRPTPRRHRRLTPLNLTQQHHLTSPRPCDHRLVIEQLLLDSVDGDALNIHSHNVSSGYDRNTASRPRNLEFFRVGQTSVGRGTALPPPSAASPLPPPPEEEEWVSVRLLRGAARPAPHSRDRRLSRTPRRPRRGFGLRR